LDFTLAVERIRAAREAIDAGGTGVVLTGRSEGFIVGRPDLAETIRRLTAYAEAGADCLYAPGIRTGPEIAAVIEAVAPKPVNVLVGSDFTTVAELAQLGVRRISVGGALARAAWAGFLEAAKEIAEQGTFTGLAGAVPFAEINRSFA
jgi:methylisocitrate lyase